MDELVKSQKPSFTVIPAKAGIQWFQRALDSRFRGSDGIWDFLRNHQYSMFKTFDPHGGGLNFGSAHGGIYL